MIQEFCTSLTATAVPYARTAGLVTEIAGIGGRYRRHWRAWQPHLDHSKNMMMEAVKTADPAEPILVLGAGLCLDVALEALAKHPSGALLVDAVLPLSTRLKLLKYPALRFEKADITGFLAPFWGSAEGDSVPLPSTAPIPLTGYSLAISLNIVSQLPMAFAGSPPSSAVERRITAALQKAHMDALHAMDCPVLLITDYERHEKTDGLTEVIPTVPPHLLPGSAKAKWLWDIAPTGETGPGRTVQLKVGCWHTEK